MVCLPATVTSAFFISVILLDLYNRDGRRVPGHALFGVFAVLLVSFICEKASQGVAWILLFAPFLLVLLGNSLRFVLSTDTPASMPEPTVSTCPCCRFRPCQCSMPCPSRPAVVPAPVCPDPVPKPACQKPKNCIKGTL